MIHKYLCGVQFRYRNLDKTPWLKEIQFDDENTHPDFKNENDNLRRARGMAFEMANIECPELRNLPREDSWWIDAVKI